jgi:uncharacterized membrane protein
MRRRTWLVALVAGFLLMGGVLPAVAQGVDQEPAAMEADIEIVDAGDAESVGPGPNGLGDFVGRLHHGVVHLPIGWLVFILLLDIAAFGFRRSAAEEVGLWALALTVLSFIPGLVTGMLRADHVADTGDVAVLVGQHQAMIFITFGLTALAFGVRWMNRDRLTGPVRGAYLTLIGLAAGLMLVAGHWGGRIVFGPDFLGF